MKIVRNISAVLMAVMMLLPFSSVAFADGTTGMTFTSVSGGMMLSSFSSADSADVVIPEKYNGKDVIEIGQSAFSSKRIKFVSIPATVIKIGESAFRDCYNLSTVEFTGNPSSLTLGAEVFNGCNKLASINIPGCVKAIPNEAFRDCVSLTSVNLPSGLKTIGKEAFKHCSSLTSVSIPSSVDSIGENAFYNCDKITSFSVSSGNTAYKSSGGCLLSADGNKLIQYPNGKSGSSFSVPSGVAEIGNGAFAFTSLSSVTLPSSVTSIGEDAFANAASLSSVNLPSGLTSIGCRAFLNCTSLRSITIPSSVVEFEEAFVGSGLETVTLENGIKEISPTAFEDCKSLRSIVIPDGVTSIGYGAFKSDTNLVSVTVPDSVTSIGSQAFKNCTALTIVSPSGSYAETYASQNGINHSTTPVNVPDNNTPGQNDPGNTNPGNDNHETDTPGTDTPGSENPGSSDPGNNADPYADSPDDNIFIRIFKAIVRFFIWLFNLVRSFVPQQA